MIRVVTLLLLVAPLAAAPVPAAKNTDDPVPKSAARLLAHRRIQKELKLTGDHRIAIVDGLADIEEELDRRREKLLRMPNPAEDVFDKLETEAREKHEKFLSGVAAKSLNAELRNRLKQIDRQIRGTGAFSDPEVQKHLALTDAQKKSVEKAAKELEERIESYLNQLGNDDSDNAKEAVLKLRQEQLKSLAGTFTAEQRTIWTSLLGEPLKGLDPVEFWFHLLEMEQLVQ